jgi:hypothetical protein
MIRSSRMHARLSCHAARECREGGPLHRRGPQRDHATRAISPGLARSPRRSMRASLPAPEAANRRNAHGGTLFV